MIKPKAINCNSQLVAFVLLICRTSDRCTDQKYTKLMKAKASPWLMSDEKPMNEMLRPEQIRHWLLFFRSVRWTVAEKQREPLWKVRGRT